MTQLVFGDGVIQRMNRAIGSRFRGRGEDADARTAKITIPQIHPINTVRDAVDVEVALADPAPPSAYVHGQQH